MSNECQSPPPGWTCSRGAGHDGPCAASPVEQNRFRIKLVAKPGEGGVVRRQDVHVLCAETGRELSGVYKVQVVFDADKNTQDIVLTIFNADVEVEGKVSAVKVVNEKFPPKRKSWWRRVLDWWAM